MNYQRKLPLVLTGTAAPRLRTWRRECLHTNIYKKLSKLPPRPTAPYVWVNAHINANVCVHRAYSKLWRLQECWFCKWRLKLIPVDKTTLCSFYCLTFTVTVMVSLSCKVTFWLIFYHTFKNTSILHFRIVVNGQPALHSMKFSRKVNASNKIILLSISLPFLGIFR